MKNKQVWHIIGLCLVVAEVILDALQKESRNGWIVLCVGVVICVLTNPYKRNFVCPECGTIFDDVDIVNIRLGGRILVTCPNCKKTNFCRVKYIKNKEK